ncbi:hypothetical protein H4Q26_011015 [Puccinia striiformis f. sp. tritici PST-130]|nr:hypothetical protein H4Q26_011015 [Puccinia striiformis f. sp. tritici PST-130]
MIVAQRPLMGPESGMVTVRLHRCLLHRFVAQPPSSHHPTADPPPVAKPKATAKKRPPRAKKAVAAQAVVSAPKSVLEPSAPPLPPPPAQPLASRLPPPPALTTLPTNQSEPPKRKEPSSAPKDHFVPPAFTPCREPSPEVNYDDFQDRDKRTRSSPEVMARIQGQSFDQLRVTVAKDPQYERLTVADKLEAENIYRTYQIAVYHLAIKTSSTSNHYLSISATTLEFEVQPTTTCFANSLHVNDRSRQTGALWDLLTLDQQAKWKDQDYLDSLPPLPTPPPTSDSEDDGDDDTTTAPRRNLPRDRFQFSTWLRNVRRDLKNMSSSHQMEATLSLRHVMPVSQFCAPLVASWPMSSSASWPKTPIRPQSFFRFVTGKQAVKDVSGSWPVPARTLKDVQKANTTAIRTKLRTALRKATHGAWQSGWPGTNTATVLRSLGVTLSIQVNERLITAAEFCKRPSDMRIGQSRRVLTALANGCADDLTDPGDDRSDDGESPDGGLSVASRPKKPLPRKKAVVVPKRATAHPKKTPTTRTKLLLGRKRSSSEDSSLPSLSQLGNWPSRTNAPQTPSSDESPLPPVSLPNHSPSVISKRSAPLPHQTSRSPSVISHRFTPLPHLSPSLSPNELCTISSNRRSPPYSLARPLFSPSSSDSDDSPPATPSTLAVGRPGTILDPSARSSSLGMLALLLAA